MIILCTLEEKNVLNKCNQNISNETGRKGCLFLANFLEAAGNPLHSYKEVECPQVLKDKY